MIRPRQYADRMPRRRITVSVPPGALDAAAELVRAGKAESLSAWVGEAMEEKARRERLSDVLAEIRADIGPATREETRWARSVLGL